MSSYMCPFPGCSAKHLVSYRRKLTHLELVHSTASTFKCFSSACIYTCGKVGELRHHLEIHHARWIIVPYRHRVWSIWFAGTVLINSEVLSKRHTGVAAFLNNSIWKRGQKRLKTYALSTGIIARPILSRETIPLSKVLCRYRIV